MRVAMQGLRGISTAQIQAGVAVAALVAVGTYLATMTWLDPMIDGSFALYEDSWRHGLVACVLLLVASVFVLRGRAAAAQELAMIALLGPLLWAGGAGLATVANQYLDQSPPQTVRVPLLRRYATSARTPSYHFVFPYWGSGRGNVDIAVPFDVYERGHEKQTWVLQARAGRYGYSWIDELAPQRSER